MAKVADRYFQVDPWSIIERGFDPSHGLVSESVFALGNEYQGIRGHFDEDYGGERLIGSYFNGLYEEESIPASYKGIPSRIRFMVNAVNWLYTRISLNGADLDLAECRCDDFIRVLDLRTGTLTREFTWHAPGGRDLRLVFTRFVSMNAPHLGYQKIEFRAVNFAGLVRIRSGLDFSVPHISKGKNYWVCQAKEQAAPYAAMLGETLTSKQRVFSGMRLTVREARDLRPILEDRLVGFDFSLPLRLGEAVFFEKQACNYAEKEAGKQREDVWAEGLRLAASYDDLDFNAALAEQAAYWERVWAVSDIKIEGDPENQQGIRFCIFQMHQTYHGQDPRNNIGAKGLTGEAYSGHTFWDTETYCLPFYLFNNPPAARNLLQYRYRTLPAALERAKEVGCRGAFYPLATIDGTESCTLWQHANIQLHVGTAIAYGIRHYVSICRDKDFLYSAGLEMLLEICRCYASRGQWGPRTGEFGFYGVMGPDEFQIMVNNNCYINFMAKKTFEYTAEAVREMLENAPDRLREVMAKTRVEPSELAVWQEMARKMRLPLDRATGVFEEHDGFFDMPHLDIQTIPTEDFPLYHHWSYDRLYRYDMIKQPDVLMFLFLHNHDFSPESKRANYEYYEPRCIHESSLSPSIHSILAAEIGKHDQALAYFKFATRMDLDNYNRNTEQGLHTTSIAAAWMNIVYGFGGMRSDGPLLAFRPSIPRAWRSYDFRVTYRGSAVEVQVDQGTARFRVTSGPVVTLSIYGEHRQVGPAALDLSIPEEYRT